jgi:hypothetical protein
MKSIVAFASLFACGSRLTDAVDPTGFETVVVGAIALLMHSA